VVDGGGASIGGGYGEEKLRGGIDVGAVVGGEGEADSGHGKWQSEAHDVAVVRLGGGRKGNQVGWAAKGEWAGRAGGLAEKKNKK
jgi:hypothetical protein